MWGTGRWLGLLVLVVVPTTCVFTSVVFTHFWLYFVISSCCAATLGRCDPCDLLIDLEGFHLISIARHECGLVLGIDFSDRFAGLQRVG